MILKYKNTIKKFMTDMVFMKTILKKWCNKKFKSKWISSSIIKRNLKTET